MPVQSCSTDGQPGWKWGTRGHCYTYTPGDRAASGQAKNKAYKQGYAEGGGHLLKSDDTMSDESLLKEHFVLHKRDHDGEDVVEEHAYVAVMLEKRGFDHIMYTDLDFRTEMLIKNGLMSSSMASMMTAHMTSDALGTMGGGSGVQAPEQGGRRRRRRRQNQVLGTQVSMLKRYIDSVTRSHIPAADYVDPVRRRFPIQVPGDIVSAMHAYGLAKPLIPMAQFRRRLITIARRKGKSFVNQLPKSWLDNMQKSDEEPEPEDVEVKIGRYEVMTKAEAKRFTLGVMYPTNETDSQGEYADAATVEEAAWYFMTKGNKAGYMHITDIEGHRIGNVVESYIYRNPEPWKITDVKGQTQMIKMGDWVGGVIWTPPVWEGIQSGRLGGFSVHGSKIVESVTA